MSAVTLHWAAAYLGKPWRSGARGPAAYYCYGLLQALAMRRLAVALPEPAGDAATAERAEFGKVLETAALQGWRRVDDADAPRADDVVLMRHIVNGKRHCGYMVEADGALGVLHADGHQTEHGPVGEVRFDSLPQATAGGYGDFEFWRHA